MTGGADKQQTNRIQVKVSLLASIYDLAFLTLWENSISIILISNTVYKFQDQVPGVKAPDATSAIHQDARGHSHAWERELGAAIPMESLVAKVWLAILQLDFALGKKVIKYL